MGIESDWRQERMGASLALGSGPDDRMFHITCRESPVRLNPFCWHSGWTKLKEDFQFGPYDQNWMLSGILTEYDGRYDRWYSFEFCQYADDVQSAKGKMIKFDTQKAHNFVTK